MSRASDILHRRKIKRSVGKKRDERIVRFLMAAQRQALANILETTGGKLSLADMEAPFVFHVVAPYTPEFLRLRAKDLARLGLTARLVIGPPRDRDLTLPEVSDEEVTRVAERLRSTVPVRFTDPHIANFNGDEESNEERVRESMKGWLNANVPIQRKPDEQQ